VSAEASGIFLDIADRVRRAKAKRAIFSPVVDLPQEFASSLQQQGALLAFQIAVERHR
jgi:hypothetical protein